MAGALAAASARQKAEASKETALRASNRAFQARSKSSFILHPSSFRESSLSELSQVDSVGSDLAHHHAWILPALGRGALRHRLVLRLEVGAQAPRARDDPGAEAAPLEIVAREAAVELAVRRGDAASQGLGVERRLGDAHADMRARDERRVAQQRDAPVHQARRLEVEYRLEKGLRALDDARDLRRKQGARFGLDPGDDLGTDERRRDGHAVAVAVGVGAEIRERAAPAVGGP